MFSCVSLKLIIFIIYIAHMNALENICYINPECKHEGNTLGVTQFEVRKWKVLKGMALAHSIFTFDGGVFYGFFSF